MNDDTMKTTPDRDLVSPETAEILDEVYGVDSW